MVVRFQSCDLTIFISDPNAVFQFAWNDWYYLSCNSQQQPRFLKFKDITDNTIDERVLCFPTLDFVSLAISCGGGFFGSPKTMRHISWGQWTILKNEVEDISSRCDEWKKTLFQEKEKVEGTSHLTHPPEARLYFKSWPSVSYFVNVLCCGT